MNQLRSSRATILSHPLVASILVTIILACSITPAFAATPTITAFAANNTQIPKYQKLELTFQISKTFAADSLLPYYYYDPTDTPAADPGRTSPYGVDGTSIDAHFVAPSRHELIVPAFYYQDYVRSGSSYETMTPTNSYAWKIRFAPEEIGVYNYYLTIQDKEGTGRYPLTGTLTFTSIASASKGFIKVSSIDPRFLVFSNGQSFIPIASGRQWWACCGTRSLNYETTFASFGQNGINLTRIWDQNDAYGLTVEGHFDAYTYPDDYNPIDRGITIDTLPKGTQMNQRGNYEEDKIIEAGEKNGVYIQLCSHGDPYWLWDASVYTETWNHNPVLFNDPHHLNYWKRNFRYRVARWGYSTAILAWETWNEHGHILAGTDVYNFYQVYGQYQQTVDPYHHLRTTSQGSQSFSPGFWSSSAVDLANYHDYLMSSRYSADLANDEANFVSRFAWCLGTKGTLCTGLGVGDGSTWQGSTKPWVWGEFDVGTTVWNQVNPNAQSGESRLRFLHNSTWAGLFTPLGTSPLDWYWDQEDAATTTARYADRKIVSNFFAPIDYAGGKFTYLMTASDAPTGYIGETIATTNAKTRVYGMRRSDKNAAYLWVQHRDHTWFNAPATPMPITSNVTLNGLDNGMTYNLNVWNTHTGAIIASTTKTPSSGAIILTISNLVDDVAVKIESANGSGGTRGLAFLPLLHK